VLVLLSGCRTLDRFDTPKGEAYCGAIVSAPFVREGFAQDLRMRLTLDTSKLTTTPGTISTDDGNVACTSRQPQLADAPMVATEAIFHDQLSTFDFGEGREQNFFAWVDSSCTGQMLAVVSLMKNDDVEVRLLKPPAAPAAPSDGGTSDAGTAPDAGVSPSPGFALFQLARQKGDCGF
jgi:hypothetical protein